MTESKRVMERDFSMYIKWRFLIPCKEYGKTKYVYEVLLLLVKINGILSKYDANNLKWNRFFNKHGIKGGNILLLKPCRGL